MIMAVRAGSPKHALVITTVGVWAYRGRDWTFLDFERATAGIFSPGTWTLLVPTCAWWPSAVRNWLKRELHITLRDSSKEQLYHTVKGIFEAGGTSPGVDAMHALLPTSDDYPYGTMEGEICDRLGCPGRIQLDEVKNCSCHISPPCLACTDPRRLYCDECGIRGDEMENMND